MKPLSSNYNGGSQKITLIDGDSIISNEKEVANTFNHFFAMTVKSLNINENKALLNPTDNLTDPVDIALKSLKFIQAYSTLRNTFAWNPNVPLRKWRFPT